MKNILLALFLLSTIIASAQDNTWEQPEEEQQKEVVQKVNPDQKYLAGAVPLVNGKVVFTKHIDAPGKRADDIYAALLKYIVKMTKESNQLGATQVLTQDSVGHAITACFEEWLVFKKNAISLDRTRLYYALEIKCQDGSADIQMSHIRYLYDEARQPQRYKAEEWITDKEAVNKKNTKLLPLSGKFRRKTIDRKDFLFGKFETLLK